MIGGIISFVTSKFGAYTLIILLVLGVLAYEKHHIAAVQHDKDQIVYDAMEKKLTAEIKKLKDDHEAERVANEAAKAQFKTDSDKTLAKVQADLELERKKHEKTRIITQQVPVYVTAHADSQCVVPAGFVWLHDSALRQNAGMADSPPGNPDAPTGVKISAVAATIRDNYAECEERGVVIEAWQRWYNENKLNYERAMERPDGHVGLDPDRGAPVGDWSADPLHQTPGGRAEIAAVGGQSRGGGQDMAGALEDVAYQLF